MTSVIWYLLQLFAFLAGGMLLAHPRIIPPSSQQTVDRLLSWCLYVLLFFMGLRTGLMEGILEEAASMGMLAVGYGTAAAAGSAAVVAAGSIVLGKPSRDTPASPETQQTRCSQAWFLEPLKLVGAASLGFFSALLLPWFSWFEDGFISWLLFLLLALVGIQIRLGNTDVLSVLRSPVALLLPLLTIVGSLLGGLLFGAASSLHPGESLALSAGFGWYSLSGVLIADMGDPMLGSVAFLSNLIRELAACVTIPLLAGMKQPYGAISVGGATSMDVTLPIIEHSCGASYVPLALAHGIVLTLAVPFLVPLLYGLA